MALEAAAWRALELAWKGFCCGTVPVGAVVSAPDGRLVFEGRSRMYEQSAPAGELANSLLAHAEVNALSRLDPDRLHEALSIATTLEPCPLCLGAIHMATVGRLVYLGSDPYGGAVGRLQSTPHTARVTLAAEGPRQDSFGLLASALHVAFYLARNPSGHVVRTHERLAPVIFAAGQAVHAVTAGSGVAHRRPLTEALPELLDAVAQCQP